MKLTEKQQQVINKLKQIDPDTSVFTDENTGLVKFIKGKLSAAKQDKAENIAREFLATNADLLNLQAGLQETLNIQTIEVDKQGFQHVYFSQLLNSIPVFEGSTQVHINPVGEVIAYKDYRLAEIQVDISPSLNQQQALAIVLKDKAIAEDQLAEQQAQLMLYRDANKKQHLAWQIQWAGKTDLASSFHLIDAHSGEILLKYTLARTAVSRLTFSAENTQNLRAKLMVKDEETTDDMIAQTAHNNAQIVYEYFLNTFGRNSYDGLGADLISTVRFGVNVNNAFWVDRYKQMVYGDGDGRRFAPLALALDIAGHELAHAVSSSTARFVYAEQSGALDESFADFFGVMISNPGEISNWEIGEGVYTPFIAGDALRDLSQPSKYRQPDHMDDYLALAHGELPDRDKNDHGYVHFNSGIANKAAYLTVAGGSHHGVSVKGIGRDKTEQIYYLALTAYLSSATASRWTFMQARYALLNACRQLYGSAGQEYSSIKNAWAAVGVGEPASDHIIIDRTIEAQLAIPDNQASGISSKMSITETGLIQDIRIDVNIQHSYIGDLIISLTAPNSDVLVLHNRQGGASHDINKSYSLSDFPALKTFVNDEVQGDWILTVADHAFADKGKLLQWKMHCLVKQKKRLALVKTQSPGLTIPDKDLNGITDTINISELGKLLKLAVSVDISHSWVSDLRVSLISPQGLEVILHNHSGYNRYAINKTYSSNNAEQLQTLLNTQIQGQWQLKVIDRYRHDQGVLNNWSLHCVYE